jgi:hypothetical protein
MKESGRQTVLRRLAYVGVGRLTVTSHLSMHSSLAARVLVLEVPVVALFGMFCSSYLH